MKDHSFLTAHFTNNDRTTVEVMWENDKEELVATYVEAREDDGEYQNLLEYIDIDTLHENTYKYIREQNQMFEDEVIQIAKDRGLILDVDDIQTDVPTYVVKAIFDEFNPTEHKEKLFLYKLKLFEADVIKNSDDKDMKKKLRQSKTIVEATHIACSIALNSGT